MILLQFDLPGNMTIPYSKDIELFAFISTKRFMNINNMKNFRYFMVNFQYFLMQVRFAEKENKSISTFMEVVQTNSSLIMVQNFKNLVNGTTCEKQIP